MPLVVTPLYAALLTLFYLALSINVIRYRYRTRVSLGAGGDRLLERAIRVHGNFNEYVPLSLVLLAFLEWLGCAPGLLHGLGVTLLLGRLSHAMGVSREPEYLPLRSIGVLATFGVLLVVSVLLLAQVL